MRCIPSCNNILFLVVRPPIRSIYYTKKENPPHYIYKSIDVENIENLFKFFVIKSTTEIEKKNYFNSK